MGLTSPPPEDVWLRWEIDFAGEADSPPAAFGVAGRFGQRASGANSPQEIFVGPFKSDADPDPYLWRARFDGLRWRDELLFRGSGDRRPLPRPATALVSLDFDQDGQDEIVAVIPGEPDVRIFKYDNATSQWIETALDAGAPVALQYRATLTGAALG